MSQLKAIQPAKIKQQKPNILIYGAAGVGKSWALTDFPNAYYIDTEGGSSMHEYVAKLDAAGSAYLGTEQGAGDMQSVIQQVYALKTEPHSYEVLVIDSISKVYNNCIADEMRRLGDKDQYGASKKKAVSYMKQLCGLLNNLNMTVFLVAHEIPKFVEANGERVQDGVTYDGWNKLEFDLDMMLNIKKAGANRNAFITKSRLSEFVEGEFFPWSYQDYISHYKGPELASDEDVQKINGLIESRAVPEQDVNKWLAAYGVNKWADVEKARILKAITYIENNFEEK